MTIYQLALARGLAVQWAIESAAFVAAVSLRGDEASYTGRGPTLDAAVMDALAVMDGAQSQISEVNP